MKLLSRVRLHPLTIGLFLLGCLTGYIKYLLAIFLLVFTHEMGHVFVASFFKRRITSITLLPFGGLTKMDSLISASIFEDLLIAIGGIFFQTLLGFLLVALWKNSLIDRDTFTFLNSYNRLIILFNLLPICPLDGYKIVKNLCEILFPYRATFALSLGVGYILLLLVVLYNWPLFYNNLFVFSFLIVMSWEEVKTSKFLLYRFYLERLERDFDYPRKDIKRLEGSFKNRINYINGRHEKEIIGALFDTRF